jgi:hypothetical protein
MTSLVGPRRVVEVFRRRIVPVNARGAGYSIIVLHRLNLTKIVGANCSSSRNRWASLSTKDAQLFLDMRRAFPPVKPFLFDDRRGGRHLGRVPSTPLCESRPLECSRGRRGRSAATSASTFRGPTAFDRGGASKSIRGMLSIASQDHRNPNQAKANWQFTRDDACVTLKRLYPHIDSCD